MRIVVHDYSGHPFQAQLSRELARRGHCVWHISSADFQTPKGRLDGDDSLGERFVSLQLTLGEVFRKDSFVKRRSQEKAFGRAVGAEIERIRPDLVLSSNAPLDTQVGIQRSTRRAGAKFIFWVQDLYGEAIFRILSSKFGVPGRVAGLFYKSLEYKMLRASDAVVAISEDFRPILVANGVHSESISIIENWAPLEDIRYERLQSRETNRPVRLLYTGTLGYKHNPSYLRDLATIDGVEVVVHSEGRVADELRNSSTDCSNLSVKPWVPFSQLSDTLAAGDVLIAMIEPDAGVFSVPSKVLTYLCAGRPVLAAIPSKNLAARIIQNAGAGLVSAPDDREEFLRNARALVASEMLRQEQAARGRRYAESNFELAGIADRFEVVIGKALGNIPYNKTAAPLQIAA